MGQKNSIGKNQKSKIKKISVITISYIIIFVALTGYFSKFVSPEAGGSDSAGYLLNAKIILNQFEVKDQIPTRVNGLACGNLDAMLTSRNEINGDCESFNRLASYPIGLGIMHAIAISIFGDNPLARQLSMAASLAGIILLIYIFILRISKSKILGLMACSLFIFSKQTIFSTTANISDLPGAFWVIFTTYLFYFLHQERKDKTNTFLVIILSVGIWMTFLTREVNVILLIPLLLFFFALPKKTMVKLTSSVVLLGIPFVYLRYKVNGTFLTPSYGSSIFELLDWKWVKSSARVEAFTIMSYLGISLLSIIPSKTTKYVKLEKVLLSQALTALLFYVFYQFTGETWWCGRFIICCIPGLIVLTTIRAEKYLNTAKENLRKKGLNFGKSEITSIAAILIVTSVTIYVNTADEKFKASSYQYLINEAPKFRTVEPTIKSMREVIPQGSLIVTMDLSASGRYYFNDYYKFLWKPGLEELSLNQIKSNFPKTYWIYNPSYTAPPTEIVEQLNIIRSNDPFVIGVLQ